MTRNEWLALQRKTATDLGRGINAKTNLDNNISLEWGYSPRQKARLSALDSHEEKLNEDIAKGRFTPEEAEEVMMKINRARGLVVPRMRKRVPTSQERYDMGLVVNKRTGEQGYMGPDGKVIFNKNALAFKDYVSFFDAYMKNKPDASEAEVNQYVGKRVQGFYRLQGIVSGVATPQEPTEPTEAQKAKFKGEVASMAPEFEKSYKELPKIGRKRAWWGTMDEIHGEEAYYKGLSAAMDDHEDIPQDVVKAEWDKWWDSKYEAEKGQTLQKFADRRTFEGEEQEQPANGFYDYEAAKKAGVTGPDKTGHWPSEFKKEGHPNLIIDGLDTRSASTTSVISTYTGLARKELGAKATPDQIAKRAKEMAKNKGWKIE